MTYEDFYDIAVYGNENWKGNFTQKEIASNAYNYMCELEESVNRGKATHSMQELCNLLREDGTEEAKEFLEQIEYVIC